MEEPLSTAKTAAAGQAATEEATWPVITDDYDGDDGYFDGVLGAVLAVAAAVGVAAAALVLVCLAGVLMRYVFRHKGSYRTREAKGTEFAQSADMALGGDPALRGDTDRGRQEYFI